MENFKHLPEPFRIRVIEPVKCTTRVYREGTIIRSDMNSFLLDSKNVFIDLLADSGTEAVTQDMQTAMMHDDEAYSGGHSYYVLAKPMKDTFGYQYTTPTHQGRDAEQIYIPVLIKKHEQEKGLDRSKMVASSNYFFDTTQGHSQINGCTVRNVYIKEASGTGVCYDFKGSFSLGGLEHDIEEVGPNNVLYIVATITNNPTGSQPISLTSLEVVYSIMKKYDVPVVMGSARFTESAYFIKQRETEYEDWTIEQITRETYKCVDMLAMSAKKDAVVPMGDLLCMKDDSFFDVYTEYRTLYVVREGFPTYGGLEGGAMERLAVGLYDDMDLDWLAYRVVQVQYLVDGLEEIGVVCQQTGDYAAFVDAGELLLHIPTDQFSAQALTCGLYKVAGTHAIEIGSFLLGRDPKTGRQLSYPVRLPHLTIPRAAYTQTCMDFIIEAFEHAKENAANIKGLTFTYEPKVLRHFTAKLKGA